MNWQVDFEERPFNLSLFGDARDPSLRVAVIAAHPDDETIGASRLLARYPRSLVIFLTDGAPRDSRFWPEDFRGTRESYTLIRRAEAETALAYAGIGLQQIIWLGGIDQEAIVAASELSSRLSDVLRLQPSVIVTHPYEGGHPDHDAAALIVRMVTSRLGMGVPLLEMTSYHARDGRLVTGEFLQKSEAKEVVFELSEAEKSRKQAMFDAYHSQRAVLQSFSIDRERLRVAPVYDFTKSPHDGKLWYECLGWQMTGEEWRSLAADAQQREFSCR